MTDIETFKLFVTSDEAEAGYIRSALASDGSRFDIEVQLHDEALASRIGVARPDAIVVGSTVPNPLSTARQLRDQTPGSEVVFLVRPEQLDRFRMSLGFVSLGSAWTVSINAAQSVLRDTLGEATRTARSRAAVANVFSRINLQLAAASQANTETEARRAQLALSERYLATILAQSPDAFLAVDRAGALIAWNEAAKRLFGLHSEILLGSPAVDLFPEEHRLELAGLIKNVQLGHKALQRAVRVSLAGEEAVIAEISFAAIHDNSGKITNVSITARDVTARQRAEDELLQLNQTLEQRVEDAIAQREEAEQALRQAQKMEALGQLTGGIAHDFNNLLQIVTGNLEILMRNLPEDGARLRRAANNAMAGAQRAAVLTQRLLAFSRRQPLAPKVLDVNRLVRDTSELLHRMLGERVELETVLATRLWAVEADANELESALLNLAVNARDAMPGGGKLTIETSNTILDEAYAADNAEVIPGQYVVICVSDTGTGMDEETIGRVFEPFFTTKETGKGTGLGLSQVYGFVKQSGGNVKIYSELRHGTTVKVYLPRHVGAAAVADIREELEAPEGAGTETVLVVEDDDDVRSYSVEVLRELGYHVLQAADADLALAIIEGSDHVSLLFTDVVLPGRMTGANLAEAARVLRPNLKVLFTTGYARNAIVHHGRLDPGVNLITKPFTYAGLASKVRDVLDSN